MNTKQDSDLKDQSVPTESLADLQLTTEQAEETRGGEVNGHGTHVSGTVGSDPWRRA